MNNSLYSSFNPQPPMRNQGVDFLTELNKFRSIFNGNPEAQVKALIQNGQLSKDQFNSYAQMANQIRPLLK